MMRLGGAALSAAVCAAVSGLSSLGDPAISAKQAHPTMAPTAQPFGEETDNSSVKKSQFFVLGLMIFSIMYSGAPISCFNGVGDGIRDKIR